MNNFKNRLLFSTLFVLIFQVTDAQTNFGYVNTDQIITEMSETKVIGEKLQKLGESYDEEFKSIYEEYDLKRKKYEAEAQTKTETINRARAQELLSIEERMQEFRQTATVDMKQKQNEYMTPVIEKMNKAIAEVAKSKNIDFVFDTAKQNLVYTNTAYNLYEDVKKKLKIK